MIREVKRYWVLCDVCGYVMPGEFDSPDRAQEAARQTGWVKADDEHYCPDCRWRVRQEAFTTQQEVEE